MLKKVKDKDSKLLKVFRPLAKDIYIYIFFLEGGGGGGGVLLRPKWTKLSK